MYNVFKNNLIDICIILFAFCYLYIIASGGYIWDDYPSSLAKGYVINSNKTILYYTYDNHIKGWIFGNGRFFPFAHYMFILYYFLQSLFIYKFFLITMTVICVIILGFFYEMVTKNKYEARLLMLLSVVALPIYMPYHSALHGYHGLFQLVFILGMTGVICGFKYYETNKQIYNIISPVSLMIAFMTYELSFVFLPVLVLVILIKTKNFVSTLKYCLPQIIVFTVFVLLNIALRLSFEQTYAGVKANFQIHSLIKTLLYQTTGAIPGFSYIAINGLNLSNIVNNISSFDVLLVIAFLLLFFAIQSKKNEYHTSVKDRFILFAVGLVLWIGVAGLYSLSVKMQNELRLGIAYSQVLHETFGVSIIILLICTTFYSFSKGLSNKVIMPLCGIFFCCIIIINQQGTREVIKKDNIVGKYQRLDMKSAIENDLLKNIPNDSIIIIDNHPERASTPNIFPAYSNRQVKSLTIKNYKKLLKSSGVNGSKCQLPTPTYITKAVSNEYFGVVIIGKIKNCIFLHENNDITNIVLENLKIFTRDPASLYSGVFYNKIADNSIDYTSSFSPFSQMKKEITSLPRGGNSHIKW